MKIALLLKGSSVNKYKHWQFKEEICVDYEKSLTNIKNNIVDLYDCDVFFHTWENEEFKNRYDKLISDYKPVSYKIEKDIPGSHGPELGAKVIQTTKCVIETFLEHVDKTNTHYDLVIVSRFDLYFAEKLNLEKITNNFNLDDKIVFVHETKVGLWGNNINLSKQLTEKQGLDDNFIIFTVSALRNYYACLFLKTETIAIDRNPKWFNPKQHPSLHHLYYLMDEDTKIINLHILLEKKYKHMHSIVKLYGETVRIVPYE